MPVSLVLVGGGHAHVEVLRRLALASAAARRPSSVTLITPSPTTPYSGMLPGVIEGLYTPGDALIDVAALVEAVPGGRVVVGRATAVDTAAKEVVVEGGGGEAGGSGRVAYDVVSLDVGSAPAWGGVPGAERWATPVRPLSGLVGLVEEAVAGAAAAAQSPPVAVVGGGAAGVELAAALAVRLGGSARVALVGGGRLLPGAPPAAAWAVTRRLEAAGVDVRPAARVVHLDGGSGGGITLTLTDDDGGGCSTTTTLLASRCLWCTGAASPPWLGAGPAPPPLTPDGFLALRASLAASDDPSSPAAAVFGAGDCAAVLPHPRPKAGVYAVRQGPPLADALLAACAGAPRPPPFTPQTQALALLSLGRRTAVGIVPLPFLPPLVVQGRWVWAWKDAVDRAWVGRYRGV